MFNLEQSIADWRRQMIAGGIKTPVPLEELESRQGNRGLDFSCPDSACQAQGNEMLE